MFQFLYKFLISRPVVELSNLVFKNGLIFGRVLLTTFQILTDFLKAFEGYDHAPKN
jgi:hypothetical protein